MPLHVVENLRTSGSLYGSAYVSGNPLMAQNLVSSGVVFATTSGILQTDSAFLFNSVSNTLFVPNISISGMTPGSVLFIGASGQVTQSNNNFFYDFNNNRLGVGINGTPAGKLHVDTDPGDQVTAVYISNDDTTYNTRALHVLTRSSGIDFTLENYALDQSGVKVAYIFGTPTGVGFSPNGMYNADFQTFNSSSGLNTVAKHRVGVINYGSNNYGGFVDFQSTTTNNTTLASHFVMSGGNNYSLGLNIRPLAASNTGLNIVGATSQSADLLRITDDSLNEWFSVGASDLIVNEIGADRDFRIESDTDSNLFNLDAGNDCIGIGGAASSVNRKLIVYCKNSGVLSNSSNLWTAFSTDISALSIGSGVVDTGYRRGAVFYAYPDSASFSGNITSMYGQTIYCGVVSGAAGSGSVDFSYGLYIAGYSGGGGGNRIIEDVYGLFIEDLTDRHNLRNHIDGLTTFGYSHVNAGNFAVSVAGTVGPRFDLVYDLGSGTLRWRNLYASSGIFATNVTVGGSGVLLGTGGDKRVVFSSGDRHVTESGFAWNYTTKAFGINQGAPSASLHLTNTPGGTSTNTFRLDGIASQTADLMTVFDSSANELFSIGSGDLIINEAGAFRSFRMESDTHTAALCMDGEFGTVGINVNVLGLGASGQILRTQSDYPNVVTNSTNFFRNINNFATGINIAAGVIDSGYRVGRWDDFYARTTNFQGTLVEQYGQVLLAGTFGTEPSGAINTIYGLFLGINSGVNCTHGIEWGIYQTATSASSQNYFKGDMRIGGTGNPGSFKVNVVGSVGPNLDIAYDLGSSPFRWRGLYASSGIFSNNVSVGGSGVLLGSLANTQIAFGTGTAITGHNSFTWNNTNQKMTIASNTTTSGIVTISGSNPEKLILTGPVNDPTGYYIRFAENTTTYQGTYIHYDSLANRLELGAHDSFDSNYASDAVRIAISRASAFVGIHHPSPVSALHIWQGDTNTGASAGVTVEQSGTGDAVIQFLLTAAQRWVVGADNSDSDKFKISDATDVGSNPILTITNAELVGINNSAPSATLQVSNAASATTIRTFRVDGISSQTADYVSVFDSSVNELFSIGTGDLIINEAGLARDLRVEGDNDASLFRLNGTTTDSAAFGGAPHSTSKLIVYCNEPTVSGDDTQFWNASYMYVGGTNISGSVTDSGYRRGIYIQGYPNTSSFIGTLANMTSIHIDHGAFGTNASGTISTSYGLRLVSYNQGTANVTNLWGLYVQDIDGTSKNYIQRDLRVGTTSNAGNFLANFAGHIGPQSDITYDLGASNLRWRGLYASSGIFASAVSVGGSGVLLGSFKDKQLTFGSGNNRLVGSEEIKWDYSNQRLFIGTLSSAPSGTLFIQPSGSTTAFIGQPIARFQRGAGGGNYIDFTSDGNFNYIISDDVGTNHKSLANLIVCTGTDLTKNYYVYFVDNASKYTGFAAYTERFTVRGTGTAGFNMAGAAPAGALEVRTAATTHYTLYLKGIAAQSQDFMRVDDGSSNELCSIGTADTVFNEAGLARDFRIESDTQANMFYVAGSTDVIGVRTAGPYSDRNIVMDVQGGGINSRFLSRHHHPSFFMGFWRDGATFQDVPYGRLMNRNADFLMSTTGYYGTTFPTGYALYNNSGARPELTASVINYSGAPNSTNKVMMLNYSGGAGGTTPGFGGFVVTTTLGPSGSAINNFNRYLMGTRILQTIWAKIPEGKTLNLGSNSIGTSGASIAMSSFSGTGRWERYSAIRAIDESGSLSSTGFVYLTGGADASFVWYVASCEMIAIDEGMPDQNHGLINVGYKENFVMDWGNFLSIGNTYLAVDTGNVTVGTSGNPGTFRINSRGSVGPNDDNLWNLGSASFRWATLFAATGNIPNLTNVSGINGIDISAYLTGSGFSVSGIAGTLSQTQVAFGAVTANTVTGEAAFIWDTSTKKLAIASNTAHNAVVTISGNNAEKLALVCANNNATGIYLRFLETTGGSYSGGYIHWDSTANRLELGTHTAATTGYTDDISSLNILMSNGYVGVRHPNPVSPLHVFENTSNTDVFTGLTIEQSGIGDSQVQFLLTGAQRWVAGIDNSDSDKFKIVKDADLSNSPFLTFTTDSRIGILNASAPSGYFHIIPTGSALDVVRVDNLSGSRLFTITSTESVFNEDGLSRDFRVESLSKPYLLFASASTNTVSIGTSVNPGSFLLNVDGNVGPSTDSSYTLGSPSFKWAGLYADTGVFTNYLGVPTGVFTQIFTSALADKQIAYGSGSILVSSGLFVWDYTNARLGVGTGTPSATLHVKAVGSNLDGTELIRLEGERSWSFFQRGTGASSYLHLTDNTGLKYLSVDTTAGFLKRSDATGSGVITFINTGSRGRTAIGFTGQSGISAFTPGSTLEIYGESGVKALNINVVKNDCDVAYTSSGTTNFWYMDASTDSVGFGAGGVSSSYAYVFQRTSFAPTSIVDFRDSAGTSAFDISSTAARFNTRVATMDFAVYGSGSLLRALISASATSHSVGIGAGSSSSYLFLVQPPTVGAVPTHYMAVRDSGALDLFNIYSTGIVINDSALDRDFRLEGLTNSNLIVADAGSDFVSFGSATNPGSFRVSVSGDLGPQADNTVYLGSSAFRWKALYATSGIFSTNVTVGGSGALVGSIRDTFVAFGSGGAITGNTNLCFNYITNRMGIGSGANSPTGPSGYLHVWPSGSTSPSTTTGAPICTFGSNRHIHFYSDSNANYIFSDADLNAHQHFFNVIVTSGTNLNRNFYWSSVADANKRAAVSTYNELFTIRGSGVAGFNMGNNQPAGALEIRTSGTSHYTLYLKGIASQTGDYLRIDDTADAFATELFSVGASDVVVNEAGGARDFRVESSNLTNIIRVNATGDCLAINNSLPTTSGNILNILPNFPAVVANSTNFMRSLDFYANTVNISSGVTDAGYRVCQWNNSFISNSGFRGTLTSQYGMVVQGGTFDGSQTPSGTITNVYGFYVSISKGTACTHTNEWGIYQTGRGNNYFANDSRFGTTANAGSFTINSAGNVGPASNNTYDLGSQTFKWRNIYGNSGIFDNLQVSGTGISMIVSYPGDVADKQIVFASGANQFVGSNLLYWNYTTNRMGIHTTTPSGVLTVTSSSTTSPWVNPIMRLMRGSTGGNWIDFAADANANYLTTNEIGANQKSFVIDVGCSGLNYNLATIVQFSTSGNGSATREVMRIAGSGQVGINTSSLTGTLTIINQASNSGVTTLLMKAITNQTAPLIDMYNTSNQSLFSVTTSGVIVNGGHTALNFRVASDNNPTLFNTNGTSDYITIGGTGNPGGFILVTSGNVGPESSGTRDIGSTTTYWNNLYVNNIWARTLNGGSVSGGGGTAGFPVTSGQVAFGSGSSLVGDHDLYWDNINKRLGINYASNPLHTLSLKTSNSTTIGMLIAGSVSQVFDLFDIVDASSNEYMGVGVVDTVFNEGAVDRDFRIETTGNPYAFFVDGGSGFVSMGGALNPGAFTLAMNGSVGPEASGTRDLGSASYPWRNLYMANNSSIYYSSLAEIYGNNGTGNIAFATSNYLAFKVASGATVTERYLMSTSGFVPWADNTYSLGMFNRGWKNLYAYDLQSVTGINGIAIANYLNSGGVSGAGLSGVISSGCVLVGTNVGTISGNTSFVWDFTNTRLGINVGRAPFHTISLRPATTSTIGMHTVANAAQTADLFHITTAFSNEMFSVGSGDVVVNDGLVGMNFRVAGNTDTSLLYTDATLDAVAIGTPPTSSFKFMVAGNIGPNTSGTRNLGSQALSYGILSLSHTGYIKFNSEMIRYDGSQFAISAGTAVSGYMRINDNTSGLPGFSFIGDTNTGFWRIGADDVGFSAGGTGRFRFDTTKISPLQTITYDLGSTTAYWRKIYVDDVICNTINGSAGGGGGIAGSIAAGQVAYGASANTIAGSNNHYWDNTNARLGLGTNSPQYPLHLNAGASTNSYLAVAATTGTTEAGIKFVSTANLEMGYLAMNIANDMYLQNSASARNISFIINGRQNATDAGGLTREALRIEASGYSPDGFTFSSAGVTGVGAAVVLPATGTFPTTTGASCDLVIEDPNKGIIMRDKTLGTWHRIFLNNGALEISPALA